MASQHSCGVCKGGFETETEYVEHTCKTGFTPQDPEHLGKKFMKIQQAALARGEAKKG